MSFQLHPQLAADTLWITDLPLCRVLLMNDSRYPWLILVPRLAELRDLHHVPATDQPQLWQEIMQASTILETLTQPHKLNVAALGNQVPQLHIHVIARQQDDAAWPGPVWGVGSAQPYAERIAEQQCKAFREAFAG
ncbi:MAG: HIT domain-containing protein [Pseudomonadota bacterium]